MFAEDMTVFFADFALDASWSPSVGGPAQPGKVLLNAADDLVLGDMVVANATTITYATGQWLGLDEGQMLTIGVDSYRVRSLPMAIDDGKLMRAEVGKV